MDTNNTPAAQAQLIEARAMLVHLQATTRREDGTFPADVRDLAAWLCSAPIAAVANAGAA